MKTSNKILLSLFIAVLLILTGIHVALTQKYKNGGFTLSKSGDNRNSVTIKPVKYVRLNGLGNVELVPSDASRLEHEKNMPASFRYYVTGDTLVVTGDSISSLPGERNDRGNIQQEITLHLPALAMIVAENTSLVMHGKSDTAQGVATRIELRESRLYFGNRRNKNNAATYFDNLVVSAKQRSEIELTSNNIHFSTLAFELEKSIFRDNEVDIKNLSIKADDSSLVQISGRNLQKLK